MSRHAVCLPLLAGLCALTASCAGQPEELREVNLRGAGATFPALLYEKWIEEHEKKQARVHISYNAVGSGEGVRLFLDGDVDFGGSDGAMTDEQMAQVKRGVQLLPVTAGMVVLAYNLPEFGGGLRLSRQTCTDIFLGKITRWDDPKIQADNPGRQLPAEKLRVVTRVDGSGTTFAFTNHLSAISPEWKGQVGVGKDVPWPLETLRGKGNEGVAGLVRRTPGAIGYVEMGYALKARLDVAWLQNRAGRFVEPTVKTGTAALGSARLPENLRLFIPDPEGADAYPIVSLSWILLYRQYDDSRKAEALREWLRWCLRDGQDHSETLGYLRLSPNMVEDGLRALDRLGK